MAESPAEALGRFAATFVRDQSHVRLTLSATLAVVDTIGAMVGALSLPEASQLLTLVTAERGGEDATAFGSGRRVSLRMAVFHNAWLADLLDLEDTYKYGGNHPGATVMPAAMAVAERRRATGREFLDAVIVGYEVENRLARALYPSHERKGFLSTGTAGALGAASAAGRLLGLDSAEMTQAMNIAAFVVPISAADTLWGGYSAKPMHAAEAARAGVEAALLAEKGFTAAPFDGAGGQEMTLVSMTSARVDLTQITTDLGRVFSLPHCSTKLYPCCGYTHGAVDAAIALHARVPKSALDDCTIRVRTYQIAVDTGLGNRYTDTASSLTACQFSFPYVVSAALLDGRLSLEQFDATRRRDPAVHALARRVSVIEEPTYTAAYPKRFPYSVEVNCRGSRYVEEVASPRGTPQHPLSPEDVAAKFYQFVSPVLGERRTSEAFDEVRNIDGDQKVADVLKSFQRRYVDGP